MDRGIALAKQGRTQRSLLWMGVKVWLLLPPRAKDLEGAIRANLAAWCSQVAPLIASLDHPKNNAVKMGKMVLSPDGRTLATISGSQDKETPDRAYLWDVTTCERILEGRSQLTITMWSTRLPSSRDGSILATGSRSKLFTTEGDGEVRLWDVYKGQPVGPTLGHKQPVTAVALTPDGVGLLTASTDGMVYRWRVPTGETAGPPLRHGHPVNDIAISPDGERILVGTGEYPANIMSKSNYGEARLWDARQGWAIGPPLELARPASALSRSAPDGARGGDSAANTETKRSTSGLRIRADRSDASSSQRFAHRRDTRESCS